VNFVAPHREGKLCVFSCFALFLGSEAKRGETLECRNINAFSAARWQPMVANDQHESFVFRSCFRVFNSCLADFVLLSTPCRVLRTMMYALITGPAEWVGFSTPPPIHLQNIRVFVCDRFLVRKRNGPKRWNTETARLAARGP
jgi:hypothetical protein